MRNKVHASIIAVITSVSLAGAALTPAVSHAYYVGKPGAKGCPYRDPLTGKYGEAKDEQLAINASGDVVQCQNGKWVKVASMTQPVKRLPIAPVGPVAPNSPVVHVSPVAPLSGAR
jgi:hypothetical protein